MPLGLSISRPGPSPRGQVHYRGSLADGRVFDSSYVRGEPTEFKVNQVISGWQEGLAMMKVGGKAKLTVPAELAYGDRQVNSIPPNSVLQFEVELLGIAGSASNSILPDDYLGRSLGSFSTKPKEGQQSSKDLVDPKVTLASNAVFAVVISALVLGGLFPDQVASLWGLQPK